MKATFEFNLPEEQGEYQRFANNDEAWRAVNDCQEQLRHYLKHEDHTKENMLRLIENLGVILFDLDLQDI